MSNNTTTKRRQGATTFNTAIEPLEGRAMMSAVPVPTGTVKFILPTVSPIALNAFNPYGPNYTGGVRVAAGDINGDGRDDFITGAGTNGHVKVFDGKTGAAIRSFFAFPGFVGSVNVAAGDINGDGRDDIIVGAGGGGSGHVKVFDGKTNAEIRSFLAYAGYNGGVRVGAGDIDGDGRTDIITGTASSAVLAHVKVFSGKTNAELRSFLAFSGNAGGINVAGGDVNGDGRDDIIVGAGVNGHVKVFDGKINAEIRSFFAFPGFVGGVNVAAGDVNGDGSDDIIVGAGAGAPGGHVKVFNGSTNAQLASFYAFGGGGFVGGVYVGAADLNGDHVVDILTGAGPGTPPSGSTAGVWYLKNSNR